MRSKMCFFPQAELLMGVRSADSQCVTGLLLTLSSRSHACCKGCYVLLRRRDLRKYIASVEWQPYKGRKAGKGRERDAIVWPASVSAHCCLFCRIAAHAEPERDEGRNVVLKLKIFL
jgi:hypothetical protein